MGFMAYNRAKTSFYRRGPAVLAAAIFLTAAALKAGCGNTGTATAQIDAYPAEAIANSAPVPPKATKTTATKTGPAATTPAATAQISDQAPANAQAVPPESVPLPDPGGGAMCATR